MESMSCPLTPKSHSLISPREFTRMLEGLTSERETHAVYLGEHGGQVFNRKHRRANCCRGSVHVLCCELVCYNISFHHSCVQHWVQQSSNVYIWSGESDQYSASSWLKHTHAFKGLVQGETLSYWQSGVLSTFTQVQFWGTCTKAWSQSAKYQILQEIQN